MHLYIKVRVVLSSSEQLTEQLLVRREQLTNVTQTTHIRPLDGPPRFTKDVFITSTLGTMGCKFRLAVSLPTLNLRLPNYRLGLSPRPRKNQYRGLGGGWDSSKTISRFLCPIFILAWEEQRSRKKLPG